MGIPLVDGRDFTTADTSDRPRTAVLNETLAATLFPDQDPLGRELDINADAYRVVGIVGDLRQQALDEPPAPQLYLPITQVGPAGTPNLVVRSSQPMSVQAPRVRASLGEFDPTLISSTFTPVDDLVDRVVSPRRFLLILIGGFAALALILAAVGIYAVIAYGVSQQTREIGIRMALGASHHDVRGRVMRTTGRLAVIGIAIGLAAALGATRLIAALLYETSPLDPLTFAAVGMGLLAVAFAAGYVPAWRASRIDPASALRAE
jgi:predicted permease